MKAALNVDTVCAPERFPPSAINFGHVTVSVNVEG